MPYKLNSAGVRAIEKFTRSKEEVQEGLLYTHLTSLQKKALQYLLDHADEGFIDSSTIARHYGLAPQAMRGPCYSLYRRGLLEKKET